VTTAIAPGEFPQIETVDFGTTYLDDVYFDREVGRYRYRDSKRFARREAVLYLTRENIDQQSQELIKVGDRLALGAISLPDFQREAAQILKRIHVQSFILGVGGVDRVTDADWLKVGRLLKQQYYDGKDPETGKRFGLKWLCQDILDGKVTPEQLRYRLSLYAQSGKVTYWEADRTAAIRSGKPYAVRKLGDAEHCRQCPEYAAMPPQPVEQIILPTQKCDCRNACKCTLLYLSLTEAIARGMQPP
jgi:hypothetical protein